MVDGDFFADMEPGALASAPPAILALMQRIPVMLAAWDAEGRTTARCPACGREGPAVTEDEAVVWLAAHMGAEVRVFVAGPEHVTGEENATAVTPQDVAAEIARRALGRGPTEVS